jgi:hypothetical protein
MSRTSRSVVGVHGIRPGGRPLPAFEDTGLG